MSFKQSAIQAERDTALARNRREIVARRAAVMTPATLARVPNTPGTPRRTIRVEDELWETALAKAEERGESLPAEIRAFLKRYVKRK